MKYVVLLFVAVISGNCLKIWKKKFKIIKKYFKLASKAAVLPEKTQNSSSSLSLGDSLDISVPFVGDLEGACLVRTGSNDTFEEIISTVYVVPLCFALNLEVDRLMADAQDLAEASETTRVEFFKRWFWTSLNTVLQLWIWF